MSTEEFPILTQLLLGSGLITREDLEDYKMISRDLKIPVLQAILNSGLINADNLKTAQEALAKVTEKSITPDIAIRALRVCMQKNIPLAKAIESVNSMHQRTQVVVAASNDLTDLLMSAKMLSQSQLGPLFVRSVESSLMIGQLLVLDDLISTEGLLAALHAVLMMRTSEMPKGDAVKGLEHANAQSISFEQALFELGLFQHPDAKTTRIGELCLMASLITREILAECLEIELFKKKQFGQILLERGLLVNEQLEAAIQLQSAISNDTLKPYQAAKALHAVCKDGKNVYEAMAQFHGAQDEGSMRLGDLIIEAGICDKEKLESVVSKNPDSAVRVGSMLLKAGVLDEKTLYSALRLQTSLRLGYMSHKKTVELLRYCFSNGVTVEKGMSDNHLYVPSRMQWTWV
ncbi:MAG: hypothetical protein SGJ27_30385 [Candidatus Melainabacteria bacterium]|nr:hypothetical protein [Candidatus Melainabacteria bacterium]